MQVHVKCSECAQNEQTGGGLASWFDSTLIVGDGLYEGTDILGCLLVQAD